MAWRDASVIARRQLLWSRLAVMVPPTPATIPFHGLKPRTYPPCRFPIVKTRSAY
jgi:hypothetical protein